MTQRIHIALMGGTGYGCGEALRLLVQHPEAEVVSVTTTSNVGVPISAIHPHLRGFYDQTFSGDVDLDRLLDAEHAVVISGLPHGASAVAIDRLLSEANAKNAGSRLHVIDLSGDLRLKTPSVHQLFYPQTPLMNERRAEFVFGLPDIGRERIQNAQHVANTGCLAAASILAVAPLAMGSFEGAISFDVTTGSSGSGRQLKQGAHHPTRHGNYRAYNPLGHRHEAEILQELGDPNGQRLRTSFVPHSMDTARGIYVTAHMEMADAQKAEALLERYSTFYASAPFVRVVEGAPELVNIVGSNFCDVGVSCRGRQVIAMSAIDNLIKGMAGTAIQNMNLMCGLPETTGLWTPSLRPV